MINKTRNASLGVGIGILMILDYEKLQQKRREEIVIDTKKEAKASNWIEVCNKGRGMCCVLLYIDEATCVVSEQRAKTPN